MRITNKHNRIAFVKTGWSDEYHGGPILGRYAHIERHKVAHELFNFLRTSSGRYYGYIPPIGSKERPPQPKIADGWLLIFVAARKGRGPLTVVGWYQSATLHSEYYDRPEYRTEPDFERDERGAKYGYCISADMAYLIPVNSRTQTISGAHFKRSPIIYVRGNGNDDAWRRDLATIADKIVRSPPSKVDSEPPTFNFPDVDHIKKVEEASIKAAFAYLKIDHQLIDRQMDKCGYDILARNKNTNKEYHIEVKGTSSELMHFYMTRREYIYMRNPQWRLLVVTNALTKPKLTLFGYDEVKNVFDFDGILWEASEKPTSPRSTSRTATSGHRELVARSVRQSSLAGRKTRRSPNGQQSR